MPIHTATARYGGVTHGCAVMPLRSSVLGLADARTQAAWARSRQSGVVVLPVVEIRRAGSCLPMFATRRTPWSAPRVPERNTIHLERVDQVVQRRLQWRRRKSAGLQRSLPQHRRVADEPKWVLLLELRLRGETTELLEQAAQPAFQ